jgi:hypothetical protein
MNQVSLALHIKVRSGQSLPAGEIVLANTGGAEVRVWRTGNQWGDTALSFEVLQGDDLLRIVRLPQVYTRNVPSSVAVPAGTIYQWPFDLGDGEWDADAPIAQAIVPGAQLIAIYDISPSAEALAHGIWTGQLRSKSVLLDE